MASFCNRFSILPRPGGMMNQIPREMKMVGAMLKILDDFQEEETKRLSQNQNR